MEDRHTLAAGQANHQIHRLSSLLVKYVLPPLGAIQYLVQGVVDLSEVRTDRWGGDGTFCSMEGLRGRDNRIRARVRLKILYLEVSVFQQCIHYRN